MADIDTVLENIQPPDSLLLQLKPNPTISVSEFLDWYLPARPGSRNWSLPVPDWYSKTHPTIHPVTAHDLVLPSSKLCENLDGDLRKAVLAGHQSVQHPVTSGVYLPLWITRAWKWANVLICKQEFWKVRLNWVDNQAEEQEWAAEFTAHVKGAILRSPWHSGLENIERGAVTTTTLARNLLSKAWINDEAIDSILQVIRTEFAGEDVERTAQVMIASTALADDIMKAESGWAYRSWAEALAAGDVTRLLMPFNVKNMHWIALEVDAPNCIINIGDSAPCVTEPYLRDITERMIRWLETCITGQSWKVNANGLPTRLQLDSRSCGIAAVNAIHRRVMPSMKPWDPRKPAKMRSFYYARCIEVGKKSDGSQCTKAADPLILESLLEHLSEKEEDRQAEERDCAYQTDSTTDIGKIGLSLEDCREATAMKQARRVQMSHRKVSCVGEQGEKKPPSAAPSAKLMKGQQPSKKHDEEVQETPKVAGVMNTAPAWFAETGFLEFKRKILNQDPSAEFSTHDPALVRCGRCGKWTPMRCKNSTERFTSHRRSKKCQNTTGAQPALTSFFSLSESFQPPIKSVEVSCPGLGYTANTRIPAYLGRTAAPCGGAPHRSKLKLEVLRQAARTAPHSGKSRRQNMLKPEALKRRVLAAERAQAKWINDHFIGAVFSAKCLHRGTTSPSSDFIGPCAKCQTILCLKIFRNALRRPAPLRTNARFTPKAYRNELLGKAFQRHTDVQELLEMDEGQSRWLVFAKRGASGRYKDHQAFLGLMDAIMKIEDRHFHGKGLQNIKYDAEFDNICTNIALISPRAYRIFQSEYGGRTLRNIQLHQQQKGRFQPGIVPENFDNVLQWTKDLAYDGPVVLSVDDTMVTKALRSYRDRDQWKLGGMHGAVKDFDSYKELLELSKIELRFLADKARAWIVTIPLPGVAPKIAATMPLHNKVSKSELRDWHDQVEQMLLERGIHFVTYDVDGVSIERGLTHDIQNEAIECGNIQSWSYLHPIPEMPPLVLQAPLLSNGKPCIMSTDGKHAKKNARGSATSGARVLAAGHYVIDYGQLAQLAEGDDTPLCRADIIGVDKQDDRAAARLFSGAVIEYVSHTQPDQLGLAIYLFIMGEIVDAQQSRTLSHEARIKMLWRGKFFLDAWRTFIIQHPYYSVNTHFITRELYDIFSIFINAMLLLIVVHRDFFPRIPLLPWLHSTEVCEHFFGCARKIQKDFTFVEWILMIPKLSTLMSSELRSKGIQAKASEHRSGYHHSWFEIKGLDPVNLATFPDDDRIQQLINAAHTEATSLLRILGMAPQPLPDNPLELQAKLAGPISLIQWHSEEHEDEHRDDNEADLLSSLDRILQEDDYDEQQHFRSEELDSKMTNLGIAAAATVVHDALRIDALPEEDDSEDARQTCRQSIENLLNEVKRKLDNSETNTSLQHDPVAKSKIHTDSTNSMAASDTSDEAKPLDFGTNSQNFKFKTLIAARKAHETDEARSAITYRGRQSMATDMVNESRGHSSSTSSPTHNVAGESSILKASMVTEMTRLISASLTSTEKAGASGIERVVRWQGVGVVASGLDVMASQSDIISNAGPAIAKRSRFLDKIGQRLDFRFVDAGVSSLTPLRQGSWAIVGFHDRIWLGQVRLIYLKGGDKRPTHNYSTTCNAISKLSRFVVLVYMPYGPLWTPLTASLLGESQPSLSSYLYLHPERLILSLDGQSLNPVASTIPLENGLSFLSPCKSFDIFWSDLTKIHRELMDAIELLVKQASSRKKHVLDGDEGADLGGGNGGKRSKS